MKILYSFYKILPRRIRWIISYAFADKYVVGITALVFKDTKIFLLKHNYQLSWGLPSGFLKKGENFKESIIREVKEETNIDIKILKLLEIKAHKKKNLIDIIVACEYIKGEIVPDRKEITAADFYSIDSIPENTLYIHQAVINSYKNIILK